MQTILAFGELEALACFRLTGFLAFYGARVAGHETCLAEHSLVFGVDFHQCACDSEAECFCLAFVAAAVQIYVDVVFVGCLEGAQGLLNDVLENGGREVNFQGALVDNDGTVAFFENDTGYSCFAATYCIYIFHAFCYFSLLMSITVGFCASWGWLGPL